MSEPLDPFHPVPGGNCKDELPLSEVMGNVKECLHVHVDLEQLRTAEALRMKFNKQRFDRMATRSSE